MNSLRLPFLVTIFTATNILGMTEVKTVNIVHAIFVPMGLVPLLELIVWLKRSILKDEKN